MTPPRPFRLADILLLVAVLAAGIAARGLYLAAACDAGRSDGPLRVQGPDDSGELARYLAENGQFGGRAPLGSVEEPTAHAAPGYPFLLSLAARLPVEANPAVRWAQAALGGLTAGFYFLFARRAFRSLAAATLAGLLCAAHPFWVVNAAELSDGVVTSFLLALVLWLGARGGESGGAFGSLLYGAVLAALALVRAALLPFAFVAVLAFLLRCRTLPRGWLCALLAFLGFVNGLVPWTLRNYRVTGDVVPVVDSAYWHLWLGNNPRATGGELPQPLALQTLAEARGEDASALAVRLAAMTQRQRYRQLAPDVVRQAWTDPAGTLQRRLSAGACFLLGEKWLQDRVPWQVADTSPPWLERVAPPALLASLLVALLLGLLGWHWTYAWRQAAWPASLAVVWLPLPYLLGHAEWLNGPRLPLDGVLLCYAAFALAWLLPRVGANLRQGPAAEEDAVA